MGTQAATSSISARETQGPGHGPGNMVRRQEAFQKTKLGSMQHFQTTIFVSHFTTTSLCLRENGTIYKGQEKVSFLFF